MKLNSNTFANAFALATAVLWVGCSILVVLFPEPARIVTEWWLHGMKMDPYVIDFSNFLGGGVTLVASAWITGYVLGWSFEVVGRKEK